MVLQTAAMALSGIAKLAQHDQAAWDPEALVEAVAVLDAALVKHAASLNTAQLAQVRNDSKCAWRYIF